jgi:hypothetical protein
MMAICVSKNLEDADRERIFGPMACDILIWEESALASIQSLETIRCSTAE